MSGDRAYGKHLGEVFHIDAAPSFVTRSLRKTEIAVTEIKCELVDFERTLPLRQENAFLVNLQVRESAVKNAEFSDFSMRKRVNSGI